MFGRAWCLKGTCDIMEVAIKAPSIRISGLLISMIRMVTIGPVDAVDRALCARSTPQDIYIWRSSCSPTCNLLPTPARPPPNHLHHHCRCYCYRAIFHYQIVYRLLLPSRPPLLPPLPNHLLPFLSLSRLSPHAAATLKLSQGPPYTPGWVGPLFSGLLTG